MFWRKTLFVRLSYKLHCFWKTFFLRWSPYGWPNTRCPIIIWSDCFWIIFRFFSSFFTNAWPFPWVWKLFKKLFSPKLVFRWSLLLTTMLFSVTRRSRSDESHWLSYWLSYWALALTLLMWPWWVMIPIEDFTDVILMTLMKVI